MAIVPYPDDRHTWSIWELKSSEATCHSATLFTTNLTWLDMESNTGHCGGKPATNPLHYGTTILGVGTAHKATVGHVHVMDDVTTDCGGWSKPIHSLSHHYRHQSVENYITLGPTPPYWRAEVAQVLTLTWRSTTGCFPVILLLMKPGHMLRRLNWKAVKQMTLPRFYTFNRNLPEPRRFKVTFTMAILMTSPCFRDITRARSALKASASHYWWTTSCIAWQWILPSGNSFGSMTVGNSATSSLPSKQ
jgi:hypothetical protein